MTSVTYHLLAMLVMASSVSANGGVAKIAEPMEITRPGHYRVVRNITAPGTSPAIAILASRVTLDVNALTLSNGDASSPVIRLGTGVQDVVIRDGYLDGGAGIYGSPKSVRIERMHIRAIKGRGISLTMDPPQNSVSVLNCTMNTGDGAGIRITGQDVRIRNNYIRGKEHGIDLMNVSNGEIVDNTVNLTADPAITIQGSGGQILIRDNVLTGDPYALRVETSNNLILNNLLTSNDDALRILGKSNRAIGNKVRGDFTTGIVVGGSSNVVEENQVTGEVCGIRFLNDNDHIYRNNILRDTKGDAVCGPPNTDAGGNIQ